MITNHLELAPLVDKLKACVSLEQRLKILKSYSGLPEKFHNNPLPLSLELILESLYAIGQGEKIFAPIDSFHGHEKEIRALLESLLPIEHFYEELGGIVGYHYQFLKLVKEQNQPPQQGERKYFRPPGLDITQLNREVNKFIRAGTETLGEIAEIYPIGGAADRLDLRHAESKKALPACTLNFLGFSLLEGLIRDVIAREYLHYKLTKKQITIPIVLMTSSEKDNLPHILRIFEAHRWYERGKEQFFFTHQPLVPVIQSNGEWVQNGPLSLLLKPGGHGALWKLLQDQGALEWLKTLRRKKGLIRQINNPVAGTDYGLLVLGGIGCRENKAFGFASCERYLKSTEGMDVLIEEKTPSGYRYTITNVEYTDFEKRGIKDVPEKENSPFSAFPANTNVLFVNLNAVRKVIGAHPFPGLLVNLKLKGKGNEAMGRLESTMQNIADYLTFDSPHRLNEDEKKKLPTFVTYNTRQKTLAATKKAYQKGGELRDTPEGVLLEILQNGKDLLAKCGFKTPPLNEAEDYLRHGPSFLFAYHPALGPLYSIIQQKLKKGLLHPGSELKLEIAALLIENLILKGSLLIVAEQITGHLEGEIREYSLSTGKCILKNVIIENKGMDATGSIYWNYAVKRFESVTIEIEGDGEFVAENVTFKGNYTISVPQGKRMTAFQKGEKVEFKLETITTPSWEWDYRFDDSDAIVLTFKQPASIISKQKKRL